MSHKGVPAELWSGGSHVCRTDFSIDVTPQDSRLVVRATLRVAPEDVSRVTAALGERPADVRVTFGRPERGEAFHLPDDKVRWHVRDPHTE